MLHFPPYHRYFIGKVDPTQLTNIPLTFRSMQDTFAFYQLLGNAESALESRFTEPLVSLHSINQLTLKNRIVQLCSATSWWHFILHVKFKETLKLHAYNLVRSTLNLKRFRYNSQWMIPLGFLPDGYDLYTSFASKVFDNSVVIYEDTNLIKVMEVEVKGQN